MRIRLLAIDFPGEGESDAIVSLVGELPCFDGTERAVLVRCGYFETRDTALLAEFRRKFISIFHFSNQTSRSVAPDDLVQLPIPNLFSDVGFVRFIGILSIGSRLGDGDENRVRAAGDFDKGRAGFFGGVGIRFDADVVIACRISVIGIYAYPRRGFGAGFVRDGGIPGIVRRKENFRIPCGLSCGDLLGELSCIGDLNGAEISMPSSVVSSLQAVIARVANVRRRSFNPFICVFFDGYSFGYDEYETDVFVFRSGYFRILA